MRSRSVGPRACRPARGLRLLVPLLLLVAPRLHAQVNIEALRRDDPSSGLAGTLAAELSVRTGSVDLVQLGIAGRLDYVAGSATTFFVGQGSIGLLSGSRFTNAGLAHLRQSMAVRPWLVPEAYVQANYDERRLLELRLLAGGGVRVRIADDPHARLWAATGAMVEHERLDLPDTVGTDPRTTVVRSSSYVALRVTAAENLVVSSTTYIQPHVSDLGDVRVLENFALAVAVTRTVALAVAFDLRYDSRPPVTVPSLDTALKSGVTLTF